MKEMCIMKKAKRISKDRGNVQKDSEKMKDYDMIDACCFGQDCLDHAARRQTPQESILLDTLGATQVTAVSHGATVTRRKSVLGAPAASTP